MKKIVFVLVAVALLSLGGVMVDTVAPSAPADEGLVLAADIGFLPLVAADPDNDDPNHGYPIND